MLYTIYNTLYLIGQKFSWSAYRLKMWLSFCRFVMGAANEEEEEEEEDDGRDPNIVREDKKRRKEEFNFERV